MRCTAIQQRLVAWQDEELAPSEAVQVEEHVARCAECQAIDRRLRVASLDDALVIPPSVAARLHAATDVDALLAAAADPRREPRYPLDPGWRRWWVDAIEVPGWMVAAAAAALLAIAGYAAHVAGELQDTQAELARATRDAAATEIAPVELPADQFQPASFQPGEEHGYR